MSTARTSVQQYLVIDLVTGDSVKFMAIPEEGYSEGKAVGWNEVPIIGRSSPLKGYQESRARRISLTIPLHAWAEQTDPTTPEDVKKACKWFLSLAYPDYQGGIKPPHRCLVKMGQQIKLQCVCTQADVRYLPPFDVDTGLAYNATVSMVFEEVDDIPKDYSDVRNE